MPNANHFWTAKEDAELLQAFSITPPHISRREFARGYSATCPYGVEAIRVRLSFLSKDFGIIRESPYPRFDEPLHLEGDAIIFPDMEMPFHHAEFINKCLELARLWNIRQCICAGDLL